MRTALAHAPTFTDAMGNNEKARALFAGEQQGQRAVVNMIKADRREWFKHPRQSRLQRIRVNGHMKLASSLSPRSLGNARTGLTMNILPIEKQIQVISALTEGCSIRSTERLTDVNRNTIMSLSPSRRRRMRAATRWHDARSASQSDRA